MSELNETFLVKTQMLDIWWCPEHNTLCYSLGVWLMHLRNRHPLIIEEEPS